MLEVRITKLDERATIPKYETDQAAAMDLTIIEDTLVPPLTQTLLPTGLGIGIPKDHVMHVYPRSSTYKKFGILLANSVGTIDPDYSGPDDQIFIAVINPGPEPVTIKAGSRVAQFLITPRPQIKWVEGEAGNQNRGGFGTTGGHGA